MKRVALILLAFAGIASATPSPTKVGDLQATGTVTAGVKLATPGTINLVSFPIVAPVGPTLNNFDPWSGGAHTQYVEIDLTNVSAGDLKITGIVAGVDGDELYIWNGAGAPVNNPNTISFTNNDSGSTALDRLWLPSGKTDHVASNDAYHFHYIGGFGWVSVGNGSSGITRAYQFSLDRACVPTALASPSTTTDWNPFTCAAGFTSYVRQDVTGSGTATINGITFAGPPNQEGRELLIQNISATGTIAFANGVGTAGNQVITPTGGTITIGPKQSITLHYDRDAVVYRVDAYTGAVSDAMTGTANTVAMFTGPHVVGNSALSVSGGTYTLLNNWLNVTDGYIVQDWSNAGNSFAPEHEFLGRNGQWTVGMDIAASPGSKDFVPVARLNTYWFNDGVTTSGSAVVTSAAEGGFDSTIIVGAAITGSGIPNGTTVLSVASPTSLTMSANATASASSVRIKIDAGTVTDLIYVNHRGSLKPVIGLGYTPPPNTFAVSAAGAGSREPTLGTFMAYPAAGQTGHVIASEDSGGTERLWTTTAGRLAGNDATTADLHIIGGETVDGTAAHTGLITGSNGLTISSGATSLLATTVTGALSVATGKIVQSSSGGTTVAATSENVSITDTESTALGVGGALSFYGAYTGTTTTPSGLIKSSKGNSSGGNWDFDLVFATRTNGSGDVAEAMRLKADKSATFASSGTFGGAAAATLSVIDIAAAGVPANMPSGAAAMNVVQPGGAGLLISRPSASASSPRVTFYKTRSTDNTRVAVANGDPLGDIQFIGASDGTTDVQTAEIKAGVTGAVASGSIPTGLFFYTGTTVATQALVLAADQGATFAGAGSFGGTLNSVGDFSVNTTSATIAAATGNTVIGGTLNIKGTTFTVGTASVSAHEVDTDTSQRPTLAGCGTSPALVGSDKSFKLTMGTGTATSCVVTFHTAYGSNASCVVTPRTHSALTDYAVTTTTLTISHSDGSSLINLVFDVDCNDH